MINTGALQTIKPIICNYKREYNDIQISSENFYSNYQNDKKNDVDTGIKRAWSATYVSQEDLY